MSTIQRPTYRLKLKIVLIAVLFLAPAVAAVEIVKSPDDTRDYAYLKLPNELEVVLISDPDADKAAAALDVHVGNSADPEDREGLAHFLEHMLFLGTKKYPQAGEYQEFINEHGGSHNAYTAFENTNYFFEIDSAYLKPALERFSQFFIAPLFNMEYVQREIHAVHSEYQAKLKEDLRRVYAALRQASNPEHPISRFAVGSLETLEDREGASIREELLRFYARYYSANLMTLVVLGKEPIADLKSWVERYFKAIPNHAAKPLEISVPVFRPDQLPATLRVIPIKETRTLMLSFPLPPLKPHFRTKPIDYTANLVGHEGRGSLLSLLKRRGWAEGLSAGISMDNTDSAAFTINMTLTQEGADHVDEMVAFVFQYLNLLRESDVEQWRFEEQRRLYDLKFRFAQRRSPTQYVSGIANDLQYFPAQDVLRVGSIMNVYDAELIRQFLDHLRPSNVLITVVAPDQLTRSVESQYGTPYSLEPLDSSLQSQWSAIATHPELSLPEHNPFIPDELALKGPDDGNAVPVRTGSTPGLELWHQQDISYKQPRSSFYFSVRSTEANRSPRSTVLTELYARMIREQLNEFSYPATLAGLNYDIYKHVRGFTVKVSGFSDKQKQLLDRILATLREPFNDAERFESVKDELERKLENSRKDRPYSQTMREVTNLLVRPSWTVAQRLDALQTLSLADLNRFTSELLSEIYVVALAHGNVDDEEAVTLSNSVAESLLKPATVHDVAPARVLKLRNGDHYVRELEIEHPDSSVTAYYQGRSKDARDQAMFQLLGQIVSAPFFDELRTRMQLGYVVFAGASPLLDVPGLIFVVQSPKADPFIIQERIELVIGTDPEAEDEEDVE